ncbi:MAG: PDZ domain-containing protein [Planctomycetes bacterium]|nr:PDZ domain-containing protein [Planctomycetota bacterium]
MLSRVSSAGLVALSLSVLLLFGGVLAAADEERPRPLAPPMDGLPAFEGLPKHLPPGIDPEQHKRVLRMMERMRKQMPFGGAPPLAGPDGVAAEPTARLGARLASPSGTLAEQLALPRGQGLVVEEVPQGSAAAKAGLKPHDILLEIDGKAVPSSVDDFARLLEKFTENTPVDVVVLRRGKNETLKGLKLPKAEPGAIVRTADVQVPLPPLPPGGPLPFAPLAPPGVAPAEGLMQPIGGNGVITTLFHDHDRFIARHQEGSLIITLTGKAGAGKEVEEIRVQDGRESDKYTSADKVPEAYRAKVKNLVELIQKSQSRIDVKMP